MSLDTLLCCGTAIALAAMLSSACTQWIEQLYSSAPSLLTFASEKQKRSQLHLYLLPLSFSACFMVFYSYDSLPLLLANACAAIFLLLITFTDFEQYIIFDKMLLPFALLAIPAFFLTVPPGSWLLIGMNRLLAAAAGGLIFFLLALLSAGAIGGGDIKLIAILGLWLDTSQLLSTVICGFALGAAAALLLLVTGRKKKKDYLAYGPYFALSALYFLLH